MSADRPYFEPAVKDDLSRFFQEDGRLQVFPQKTQSCWDQDYEEVTSLIAEGF
jgi:hypothetical protein